jgi:hypothetical protein
MANEELATISRKRGIEFDKHICDLRRGPGLANGELAAPPELPHFPFHILHSGFRSSEVKRAGTGARP